MTVRVLLLAFFSIFIAWALPVAAQEQRYEAPKHQVGDWHLIQRGGGKPYKLVIGKIDEKGMLYFYRGKDLGSVTTSDLNTVSLPFFLDGSWQRQTLSPHDYQYAFPLYVGKKWSGESDWTIGGG